MLNLYFDFGNEPIHCGRDAESGSHIAEAVYLWKHGQLTADPCDYWARGVSVESLPDIQMLLTTGPAFRGPHVDGEPQLPVVATLLSGRKLWVFLPENGAVKRFIIRRGWKLRELAEYLAVSLLLLDEIRKKLKKTNDALWFTETRKFGQVPDRFAGAGKHHSDAGECGTRGLDWCGGAQLARWSGWCGSAVVNGGFGRVGSITDKDTTDGLAPSHRGNGGQC